MEHRYAMGQILGRPLRENEFVHHRNGIKTDNLPENLELVLQNPHTGSIQCPFCAKEFAVR